MRIKTHIAKLLVGVLTILSLSTNTYPAFAATNYIEFNVDNPNYVVNYEDDSIHKLVVNVDVGNTPTGQFFLSVGDETSLLLGTYTNGKVEFTLDESIIKLENYNTPMYIQYEPGTGETYPPIGKTQIATLYVVNITDITINGSTSTRAGSDAYFPVTYNFNHDVLDHYDVVDCMPDNAIQYTVSGNTKPGTGFDYTNSNLGILHVDENEPVNTKITVTAKYKDITDSIVFNVAAKSTIETHSATFYIPNTDGDYTYYDSKAVEHGSKIDVMPDTPTKSGYTFNGWFLDQDCTVIFDKDTNIYNSIKVYGSFEKLPEYVDLSFATSGGTIVPALHIPKGYTASAPVTTKDNSNFDGWYTDTNYDTKYDFSRPITTTAQLYAKWSNITRYNTVSFNTFGGTNCPSQNVITDGKAIRPADPKRDGYVFYNWYSDKSALNTNGVVINELVTPYNFNTLVTGDLGLYAGYKAATSIDITLHKNDGTDTKQVLTKDYGAEVTLSDDVFTRAGYTFTGWSLSPYDGEIPDTFTATRSLDVYALWEKEDGTVTVTFDAKGGTPTQATATCDPGETLDLSGITATKAGYTFQGWCLDSEATLFYYSALHDCREIPVNSNITLYAAYIPTNKEGLISVTFDTGVDDQFVNTQWITPGTTPVRPATPIYPNHTLNNWSIGGGEYTFESTLDESQNIIATWLSLETEEPKHATFIIDGTEDPTLKQEIPDTGRIYEPTVKPVTGKTFQGWFSDENCTEPFDFTASYDDDVEVYGTYNSDTDAKYVICVDGNNGAFYSYSEKDLTNNKFNNFDFINDANKRDKVYLYVGQDCDDLVEELEKNKLYPFRPDYTFNKITTTSENDIIPTVNKSQTVYARFNHADSVNIILDRNVTGSTADVHNVNKGTLITLPKYTRPGYKHTGWATERIGNAVYKCNSQYVAGELESNHLYATWVTDEEYDTALKLIYHTGYPRNSDTTVVTYTATEVTEPLDYVPRPGYKFIGWFQDTGLTTEFTFGTTIDKTYNLYPKYTPMGNITVTVSSDAYTPPDPMGFIYTVPAEYRASNSNILNYNYLVDDAIGQPTHTVTESIVYDSTVTLATLFSSAHMPYKEGYVLKNFDVYADGSTTPLATEVTEYRINDSHTGYHFYLNWEYTNTSRTIYFDPNNGGEQTSITHVQPFTFKFPAASKTDYKFLGWAENENETDLYSMYKTDDYWLSTKVGNDNTFHAIFIPDVGGDVTAYDVRFHTNGGTLIPNKRVLVGAKVIRPTDPVNEGYTLTNWYKDPELTDVYDFDSPVVGELDLYAKWIDSRPQYTISFITQGAPEMEDVHVYEGDVPVKPDDPTYTGHEFLGWYEDALYLQEFDWTRQVFDNYTLYAKWRETTPTPPPITDTYTVSFNSHGGSNVATQEVDSGNKATKPTTPTRDGFDFIGWYLEDTYETPYNFNTPVTANLELHAKWEEVATKFTVTFDSNGGTTVSAQEVVSGNKVTRPEDPTYLDYVFTGWYYNRQATRPFNFDTAITRNIKLYAGWDLNYTTNTVTFETNGGTEVAPQTVIYNRTVRIPMQPMKINWYFVGWYEDMDCTIPFDFGTRIRENKTLYARWSDHLDIIEDPDIIYVKGTIENGEHIDVYLTNNKLEEPMHTITDDTGFYRFTNVPLGIYNLYFTVDNIQTTSMVTVNKTIETTTSVRSNASLVESDNMSVISYVDVIAAQSAENSGTYTAGLQTLQRNKDDKKQNDIIEKTDYDTVNDWYDLYFTHDAVELDSTSNVVEYIIPMTFINKSSFSMFRNIDNKVEKLTELNERPVDPVDGTFYINRRQKYLHVYADKYGLYALNMFDLSRDSDKPKSEADKGLKYLKIADIETEDGKTEAVYAVYNTKDDKLMYNGRKHVEIGNTKKAKKKKSWSCDVPVTISSNFISANNIKITYNFKNNKNAYTLASSTAEDKHAPYFYIKLKAPKGSSKAVKRAVKKANKILKKKENRTYFDIPRCDISTNVDNNNRTVIKLKSDSKTTIKQVSRIVDGYSVKLKKTDYSYAVSGNTIKIIADDTTGRGKCNFIGYYEETSSK